MAENQAAWLDGVGQELRVGPSEVPKPGADDVIIRNHAVAINPLDWKRQDTGLFTETWPTLLGYDIAGEVVKIGNNVNKLKKGDRVIAHANGTGGFQLYTAADSRAAAILPAHVSFSEGVVIPCAFNASVMGLCDQSGNSLGLPSPSLNPKPCGKTILIWGGSSSVGALAIQLAVAAGVKVITVASSRNFDLCKRCGASEVFDYNKDSIVDDVVNAVKSAGGDFAGVFDTISTAESFKPVVRVVEALGGDTVSVVLPTVPEAPSGIKVNVIHGYGPFIFSFWESYITPALQDGKLKCLPEPSVVGKGLESFQKGVDESRKGVSAKKLVVEL